VNSKQNDRPRWLTPADAVPETMTDELFAGLAVGDAVEALVCLGGDDPTPVSLSLVKVSNSKLGIHTRRGFAARILFGAQVVRRIRRDSASVGQAPEAATS
jgi:hypothetical protein